MQIPTEALRKMSVSHKVPLSRSTSLGSNRHPGIHRSCQRKRNLHILHASKVHKKVEAERAGSEKSDTVHW